MGTINVTPDSFSDGGRFFQTDQAIKLGESLASQGADILDVGGESTRPFSKPVEPEEEISRVVPVVKGLVKRTSTPISIDTCKAQVARAALDAGATIVNDVSGLRFDNQLAKLVAATSVPLVLMHMQGTPRTMQIEPHYRSLLSEIIAFLEERIQYACIAGVIPDQIIVDPGVGFGKTVEHNLLIVKHLDLLAAFGRPILLGVSRKAFIGDVLDKKVTEREPGSWATVCAGIMKGAHIVRVHEVATCRQMADMIDAIINVQL
jgi:dihydropteroate synthase